MIGRRTRIVAIAGLVLVLVVGATTASAYDWNAQSSQATTSFDGEQFLRLHINPISPADKLFQGANPDNGQPIAQWYVQLNPPREMVIPPEDLPRGFTFTRTGDGRFQLNGIPFNAPVYFVAHGAKDGEQIVKLPGMNAWFYGGGNFQVGVLPLGVSWLPLWGSIGLLIH